MEHQKTFNATDSGLVLVSTVNTFQVATASGCSVPPTNLCAAAAGASDQNGALWVVYRWKGSTNWHYRILTSSDGGSTWSTSVAATNIPGKFAMTLTSLSGTKMLFAYARNAQSDLYYRVFDGSTWGSVSTITAGIATGVAKQLSSATVNGTKQAYIAFLSGGYQGTLKVAKFSGNGVFEAIETADSTLTHQLPAISVTYDDNVRITTISNNKVYETMKNSSGWQVPTIPYGTTFDLVDQLTAPVIGFANIGENGVLWTEGPGSFSFLWGMWNYLSLFTGVCEGGFFNHHEPPLRYESGFMGTEMQAVTNLTASGFHLTSGYASGYSSRDYTKGIADYGCPSPIFRTQANIAEAGSQFTYSLQGPYPGGPPPHGEPNPEVKEPKNSPHWFKWPAWWWGPYVAFWHALY